jgi:zinc protease
MTGLLGRLPTHERRLDNGLTVIVREDHSAPVVAVVTHVKAGYFDEPDSLIGISHVLEHMYFKGTATRGPGEIARATKGAGGYLNAGTIYDHTTYYTVLPSTSLAQALEIQADALQRSAIDEDELRRELLVIIQEARRKLDNPAAVAQETLFETMFDVHRIRRWRIGTEDVLSGLTRDDVWTYYRNLYRASNTILVIAGDVDPDAAFDLAQRCYGGMDAGEPLRDVGPREPERDEFRYREMDGDIAQSHAEWGWRAPAATDGDAPILEVLAIALGQGRASRLYRHVRDAGHAAAISSYCYTPGDIGIFGISAEIEPQDAAAALAATARVLQQVREHGFTADEVERARNIFEARMIRRTETAEGQANLIAEWQAHGDWRRAENHLARAMAATPAQLSAAARRYLRPEHGTLLLYRPRSAEPFATDSEEVFRRLFGAVAVPAPDSSPPRTAGPQSAVQRAGMEPQRVEDGVHIYVLDECGARVIVKPRMTTPLVSLGLYCRGGILAEHDASAGATGLMTRTSVKGTRNRTGAQLAEESESLGASILPGAGADLVHWSISLPARHLEAGTELLLDAALEPAFRTEDAERERKITLADLERLRDDMQQYPVRLALSAAFGDHPYGFSIARLEHSIRDMDADALAHWHRDRVLSGAPAVLVVGDIADPDRVAAQVADRLRGRLAHPIGLAARPAAWVGAPRRYVEERDKAQTAIAFAFPGPPRNHPDVYALEVLSAAIAGLGGRLFEELRSRRSLAYAVSALPIARWVGGAFVAFIGTAPEREEEARESMMAELARTATTPLERDELERARRYLIGSWQIRQQTHSRQLVNIAGALLLGEGLSELRDFIPRVATVTAEQIRAAAERWLQPDKMVEGVVRGTGGSR